MLEKHLLVISCSNKKNKEEGLLPAIERYTGAWYGVINKLKKENKFPKNIDIVIISAKYGFLEHDDLIEWYDLRMNKNRAKELNREIINKFKNFIDDNHYETVCVNLGNDYLPAIDGFRDIIPNDTKIIYVKGKLGERKKQIRGHILGLT